MPTRRQPRRRRKQAGPRKTLPDGTIYVGDIGVLATDRDGELVQCHLCGRWLRTIGGAHLGQRHGWNAEQYRAAFGLTGHRSLECPARGQQRSTVQRRRMRDEPAIRAAISRGIQRARNGELTRAARRADSNKARRTYRRPERLDIQRRNAKHGGAAQAAAAAARLDATARKLGYRDIADYLRARSVSQRRTVSAIAAELGVARETVIKLLERHQIPRAAQHDPQDERRTVAKHGFDSFADYLRDRAKAGTTVAEMAGELGHSDTWLRARARRDGLQALIRPKDTMAAARQYAARRGEQDLVVYVRRRYEVDGRTARQLRAELGLSGQQIARLLDQAGVERRHDPAVNTRRALAEVGFYRLENYIRDRHQRGDSVTAMAAELGRSQPWLAERVRAAGLAHLIRPTGRPYLDPDELARERGYPDLAAYARQRAGDGASMRDMAGELGHSDTWLAGQLRDRGLGRLIRRRGDRYGRRGRPRT
jgi:transcriptional regulator with XRE-family HTH domain